MLRPASDRWRGVFDALPRIARGADAFFAEPDAAVRRIQPGPEWDRYAAQARRVHAETEQFFAALDSIAGPDSGRVRRDRAAAVEAFGWLDAESAERSAEGRPEVEALVAIRGDRLIGVTVFRETDEALEVLAEGNTRPPGPDGRSADQALQYALARTAAHAGYEVRSRERVDEQDRAGQHAREAALGRTRYDDGLTTYGWSAAEARTIAREVAHPGDTARLPDLTVPNARYWEHVAGHISEFLETGGRLRAVRHSAPADRTPEGLDGQSVVELARLAAVQQEGYATVDAPFAPSGDQARDLVTLIAEHQGSTVGTLTFGEGAGLLRVVQETGSFQTDRSAMYALRSGLVAVAARRGFGRTFDLEAGPATASAVETVRESARLQAILGPQYGLISPRHQLDVAGAEPSEVLQRVSNFERQQGDVLVLAPTSERFKELRDQIVGRLADDGTATPAYLAQALAPGMGDQSHLNLTRIAFAFRDGEPTAVVRFHLRPRHVELDAAAVVPGSGTPADVAAATVEGPIRAAGGRPLSGAVPDEVGRLYARAGAGLVERGRLDGVPGLVTAELDSTTAGKIVRAVDAGRDRQDTLAPVDLDLIATEVRTFDRTGLQLAVLDHGDTEDRRRAELVHRLHPAHVADRDLPGDDRHRFTVVAVERGSAVSFMTVDATPKEPLTVVAAGDSLPEPAHHALHWWLANHAVAVDRHVVLSEPVNRYLAGDRADERTAHWTIPEMKQLIRGVRIRAGDRHDALLAGVGEAGPSANAEALPLPETPTAAERGERVEATGRAAWERRDRSDPRWTRLQRGG